MKELNLDDVNQVAGGGFTISCCEYNLFGMSFKFDVFSYSGGFGGALNSGYGFDRMSAYNRL